jgi:hypothetical protein
MSASHVLRQVQQAGGTLRLDSGGLLLLAEHELPAELVGLVRSHKPEIISTLEIVTRACSGLPLSPNRFMAEMTAEDIADIEAGYIPVETLRAYAESISMRQVGRPIN